MGLLKHAILPFYALINAVFAYKCLIAEDISLFVDLWDRNITQVPVTNLEMHFMHAVGGVFLILLVNNVVAISKENSHYRGMAVLLQTLFFTVDIYSYWSGGKAIPPVVLFIVGAGVVGLIVHSMEPGIFTQDKDGGGKKRK
jgi:hypothetical protein